MDYNKKSFKNEKSRKVMCLVLWDKTRQKIFVLHFPDKHTKISPRATSSHVSYGIKNAQSSIPPMTLEPTHAFMLLMLLNTHNIYITQSLYFSQFHKKTISMI